MDKGFPDWVCKGAYAIGSACGECKKCAEERMEIARRGGKEPEWRTLAGGSPAVATVPRDELLKLYAWIGENLDRWLDRKSVGKAVIEISAKIADLVET